MRVVQDPLVDGIDGREAAAFERAVRFAFHRLEGRAREAGGGGKGGGVEQAHGLAVEAEVFQLGAEIDGAHQHAQQQPHKREQRDRDGKLGFQCFCPSHTVVTSKPRMPRKTFFCLF